MSRNLSDSKQERDLLNRIARLEQLQRERGTLQVQGDNALQIAYTDDAVFHINVAPHTGLIGTFLFTLQYDNPNPNDVVFGDVDIAVNKGTDEFTPVYNLSAYNGGLKTEVINDQFLARSWHTAEGYYPVVKVVRLSTYSSSTAADFYIHYRWR